MIPLISKFRLFTLFYTFTLISFEVIIFTQQFMLILSSCVGSHPGCLLTLGRETGSLINYYGDSVTSTHQMIFSLGPFSSVMNSPTFPTLYSRLRGIWSQAWGGWRGPSLPSSSLFQGYASQSILGSLPSLRLSRHHFCSTLPCFRFPFPFCAVFLTFTTTSGHPLAPP